MRVALDEWALIAANRALKPRAVNLDGLIGLAEKRVVSITGIRRCGKSSVLMLLYRRLSELGFKAVYVNLEDNRFRFPGALDEVLKHSGSAEWLLLDEITSVPGWEGWLHRVNEMKAVKIIVSSSLNKLSRFPPKPLRGRLSYSELFPLSFSEFLEFKGIKPEPFTLKGIGAIESALEEFLVFGGFPEIVLSDRKVELLQEYLNSIVALDIASFSSSSFSLVSDFSELLLSATIFSATKAENSMKAMGHKVSKSTLLDLEKFFETAHLAFFVPVFSHKIKDKKLFPRKIYFGDSGFYYAAKGKRDFGRLYETAVFLKLRRSLNPLEQIAYYKSKNGLEVDFVLRQGTTAKKLIQVAYELNESIESREAKALLEAAKEFGLKGTKKELLIITKSMEGQEKSEGRTITYLPLWKWLLELH
ncbi:MAG: ATP-binding protein [Candidatus Diapherotrites archaeon]